MVSRAILYTRALLYIYRSFLIPLLRHRHWRRRRALRLGLLDARGIRARASLPLQLGETVEESRGAQRRPLGTYKFVFKHTYIDTSSIFNPHRYLSTRTILTLSQVSIAHFLLFPSLFLSAVVVACSLIWLTYLTNEFYALSFLQDSLGEYTRSNTLENSHSPAPFRMI